MVFHRYPSLTSHLNARSLIYLFKFEKKKKSSPNIDNDEDLLDDFFFTAADLKVRKYLNPTHIYKVNVVRFPRNSQEKCLKSMN